MAGNSNRLVMGWWNREQSLDADGKLYAASVPYIVYGPDDEDDVLAYAYSAVPKTMDDLDLDQISVKERIGENCWKITAEYPHKERNGTDQQQQQEPEFAFSISAGTKHITHSIRTIGNYAPPGETAPSYGGAINVNEKGEAAGVDIVSSTFSFTEKHFYDNSHITNTFKRNVASLVGKVNSGTFRGWEAGELLFVGADGSRKGNTAKDRWEITFRYRVSMNRTGVTVGNISITDQVNGWDYLWVRYENTINQKTLTKKIASAHLEQVYVYASFSVLS